MHPAITSRIKIMSNLDIAERRLPQDGDFNVMLEGRPIDLRVSTMPGTWGEKTVIRIIDSEHSRLGLDQLGFSSATLSQWQSLIEHPNGVVLVTGPTGSGKSTTLYSVLGQLNSADLNIATVEIRREAGRRALRAGTVICFEIAFPARCRAWRRAGANVLLNPANYGWFGRTGFRAQVRALAALRAAETGASVVVAGNTGPTIFYDPVGRPYGAFRSVNLDSGAVGDPADPEDDANTFLTGWTSAELVVDEDLPPYARWGDLPWFALAVVLLGVGLRRRVPSSSPPIEGANVPSPEPESTSAGPSSEIL